MPRPRLLIIPNATEVEWDVRDELEQWADLAFLERAAGSDVEVAEQAAAELEARGWSSAVVVCDEWAIVNTVAVATHRPELIEALVLGHACLELRTGGERPSLNGPVADGYQQVLRTDYRTFARVLTQVTMGDFDEQRVDEFIARVSHEDMLATWERVQAHRDTNFEPLLRSLDVPLLFVKHDGCLLWTDDSFAAATAAFPEARTAILAQKPSVSPEFPPLLRDFCTALAAEPA